MDNRTPKGSWTKSQLIAIGVGWPAEKGWLRKVVGNEISEENASIFESKMKANGREPMIDINAKEVIKNIQELSDGTFSILARAMNFELERRDSIDTDS